MKDFDLRKYLAENKLLKEDNYDDSYDLENIKNIDILKIGGHLANYLGFPLRNVKIEDDIIVLGRNRYKVVPGLSNDFDIVNVDTNEIMDLDENKLVKEEVYADMEDDLSEVTVYGFGQQFTGVETSDGKYYFIHYFDDVDGDDSVPFLFNHLKKMGGKMEIDEEEITLEISYENLRPMMGIENSKSDKEDDSLDSSAAGNIEATYSKPGGPVFKSYSDFQDYYK
ncbi:MAG: hypothetical protein CMC82_01965 [Flavobacteriaceae bacterium]|nr:hypothetical protein [Flavobacteriaceae bacterium]|tara:strand:+ start:435 stop:1109 length:675 start_codon:yes stop_codon:yes gene_type:complete